MNTIVRAVKRAYTVIRTRLSRTWKWYRGRSKRQQWIIGGLMALLLIGAIALAHSGKTPEENVAARTVTVESINSLSGNATGGSILGTVQSVQEADLLAQVGGTVSSVHTTLGARVPAGFVIADLDNASQAAAVLQAEGGYDAAIAARDIVRAQSGNAQTSFAEAQSSARATYQSAFTTIDSTLRNSVDQLFGAPTPLGPQLLINQGTSYQLPQKRRALADRIDTWRASLATVDSQDPAALLAQATANTQAVSSFLVELSQAANDRASGATPAQLAALATARATVDGELAALSAARDAYNAKKTGATVAGSGSDANGTQLASANANVTSALGGLRAAQAAYEKTRIRATIGGTVNYLQIKRGQFVNAFQRVATVAQNGALEIVANVSEDQSTLLTAGMKVTVEGGHDGIVTSVAPALNPTTKQVEVHIAVDASPDLVNGQSVRVSLPSEVASTDTKATTTESTPTVLLLPLTSVKLMADARAVFSVGEDGRLVAHTVTIGEVRGDRIEITSPLSSDLRIVTDVRGLSEGQKVTIAPAS